MMYVGYQNGVPVMVKDTREALEKIPCISFDEIREHDGNVKLVNGEILFDGAIKEKELEIAFNAFDSLVEKRLNDFAATRRYNSIYTAANYRGNPVEKYSTEGEYCFRMLGETYAKCEELLNTLMPQVVAGVREIPTWEEIEAKLPVLQWPDEVI